VRRDGDVQRRQAVPAVHVPVLAEGRDVGPRQRKEGGAVTTKTETWKCAGCRPPCIVTVKFSVITPNTPIRCPYYGRLATWVRVKGKEVGP
jgi:hypothetical protein